MTIDEAPWAIGKIDFGGRKILYPVSQKDMEADTSWASSCFSRMKLTPGSPVHLIGPGSDSISIWPLENALIRLEIPFSCAEPNSYDVARTEMYVRRFDLQAIIGLTGEIVEGLISNFNADLFIKKVPVIVAMPCAWPALDKLGVPFWKFQPLGPTFGIAAPHSTEFHYNTNDWLLEQRSGELIITNLENRLKKILRMQTGVRGIPCADSLGNGFFALY